MRTLIWIGAGALLFAVLLLWWEQPAPPPRLDDQGLYPWQVQVTREGNSRVLGVWLAKDTLAHARERFGDRMQLALFENPDGVLSLEAFYGELTRGGLTARVILTAELPAEGLAGIRERARSKERLDSGAVRYQLARADLPQAMEATITGLTWLPAADFDEELVRRRFGAPQKVLTAAEGARHFLYPERGLDLVLAPGGEAALQFVPPSEFDRLRRPLQP